MNKPVVAIMERDPLLRSEIEHLLISNGYETLFFKRRVELLRALEAPLFHCVIIGIAGSDRDGLRTADIELASRISAMPTAPKQILISTRNAVAEEMRRFHGYAMTWLAARFKAEDLLAKLESTHKALVERKWVAAFALQGITAGQWVYAK